ncbi:uncharacterized protein MYCGRDRAFT_39064 [Zymoseptoria tritici IPO323]|uniref:SET domain-containing protein n=1 Tax=Zymoseptoria tritici (strain CBS 115943 / IPO323) TaxID=336722 RepID=F9X6D3_ZYMTI|nr:uncharacterized protein MYCGRDRAFT_39064 [Zymoseptoria tritici IPO323]EGP88877.1 hypothetical protein MYCGRDRAFT_39064 [Zymoseptoria tritici IPO323]
MAAPPSIEADAQKLINLLNRQKALHRSANARRGQVAQNKPSRADLQDQFSEQAEWELAQELAKPQGIIRTTIVGYAYSPCILPVAQLKPITIDELRLETHHRGRVLFVKTFGLPLRFQAVQNCVEDQVGEVDRLSVYNFEKSLKSTEVLPRGAVFAVKEPYYKVTGDGGVQVRVDHPSDLVKMSEDDARVPLGLQPKLRELREDDSAEQWKAKGNEAFKMKDFRGAVNAYSNGLKVTGSDIQQMTTKKDLLRNRAIAHISLSRFEVGLEDAQKAVVMTGGGHNQEFEKSKNNAKAFYRAGCAAYHLRKFQLAKSEFEKVLECMPYDADAIRELVRTGRRLEEQETGTYNFEEMIKTVKQRKQRRLDYADYDLKVIKKQSKTGGNGLFATEPIKAGELVLCEKAFAVAFKDEEVGKSGLIVNMNRDTMSTGTHTTRLISVVNKLLHNPNQAALFSELNDGGGYTPQSKIKLVDGVVPVDTFQVQAALEINGFGCPEMATAIGTRPEEKEEASDTATGVWITASFANHDCIGNAHRSFIGDFMIIRATKDIAKDEEILHTYVEANDDHEQFQKTLQRSWDFKCRCRLCVAESKTSGQQRKHRMGLFKTANEFLRASPVNPVKAPAKHLVTQAEKLWKRLDESYDDKVFTRGLPRRGLRDLAHWLCMAHMLLGSHHSTIQDWATRCLQSQGILISMVDHKLIVDRKLSQHDDTGVHAATYLASVYQDQDPAIATQLEGLASELYQIRVGSMHGYNGNSRI